MWDVITKFIEEAVAAKDEQELFGMLERTALRLGYPYYAFGALWGDPAAYEDHKAPAVRLNYPAEWIARYFAAGYDKIDPVVLIAPYAQTSVTWDELRHYRPEFFDEASSFGLVDGLTIPLRSIQGCYVMCLAATEKEPMLSVKRAQLEAFAHGFFAAYLHLRGLESATHDLSANTVDVIRLSMAGLKTDEIAKRLSLTVDGVHWCIKDARKKLGATTLAQLHLKAIQQGIVTFTGDE